MSAITKSRTNIFVAIGSLFSSGVDIENNEEKLPKELDDVLKALSAKEKEAEQAINVAGPSSKKGGIRKKYETSKIIPAQEMTPEKLEKMSKILKGNDREIEQ